MRSTEIKPWGSLNWPNRISILRLLMVAPFLVLLMNQRHWAHARYAAVGIFLVMAFSDFLDGLLARKLEEKTRLGAILDPLADKALIICAVVLLSQPASAVPGAAVPNWVVVAVVGKDLWVIAGFLVIYLVTDRFRVQPTLAGKASTFGQLVMVAAVLLAPDFDRLSADVGGYLARGAEYVVSALCALAVVSYTRLGLIFIAQEEKPLDQDAAPAGTEPDAADQPH